MEPIGPADILQHLKRIVDETKEPGIAIGLLTSLQRNRWAEIYSSMAQGKIFLKTNMKFKTPWCPFHV